ncbi:TetR/AcrR family transcriptional regulator [Amycolatopsis alba]|uniref:TetR family transcriptional regulator n=1 Tax=Amycolatopsis alba DSM 44262 TaxID=1125972 RepID=A0A229S2P6_AMYAL|nr:TetR family transcriptional regulator [Amycolatopsis alba]OXM53075.1 TetR family transcriptional regulator [Amycolatopsis alba DSM 44262]
MTDGRLAKGEQRKRELIEATLRIVARDGASGVSHRTVAREAGLPATAAAYHFRGIEDLLTAALTRCMDEDAERMRVLAEETGGDALPKFAALLARVAAEPGHLLAEYELYLLAAREPRLRESTDRWMAALADFARRHTDDPVRVEMLVGLVDGLLLQGLLRDEPPMAERFEAILRTALGS